MGYSVVELGSGSVSGYNTADYGDVTGLFMEVQITLSTAAPVGSRIYVLTCQASGGDSYMGPEGVGALLPVSDDAGNSYATAGDWIFSGEFGENSLWFADVTTALAAGQKITVCWVPNYSSPVPTGGGVDAEGFTVVQSVSAAAIAILGLDYTAGPPGSQEDEYSTELPGDNAVLPDEDNAEGRSSPVILSEKLFHSQLGRHSGGLVARNGILLVWMGVVAWASELTAPAGWEITDPVTPIDLGGSGVFSSISCAAETDTTILRPGAPLSDPYGATQVKTYLFWLVETDAGQFEVPAYTLPASTGPFGAFQRVIGRLWFAFLHLLPPVPGRVSIDRAPAARRLLRAYCTPAGVLSVDRFDDGVPESVTQTIQIEAAGVTGVVLHARPCGRFEMLYCLFEVLVWRYSNDAGRTWSMPSTIVDGYQDVAYALDEARGLAVVALYDESNQTWYWCVGTVGSDGLTWTYTTPLSLAPDALDGGCMIRRADGVFEFAYSTNATPPVQTILRGREVAQSGSGIWA